MIILFVKYKVLPRNPHRSPFITYRFDFDLYSYLIDTLHRFAYSSRIVNGDREIAIAVKHFALISYNM